MPKRFYAIKRGKKTGIFTGQWKEIESKYIKGFSNPQFKGFNDREEAERYMGEPLRVTRKRDKEGIRKNQLENEKNNRELKAEKEKLKKKKEMLKERLMYSGDNDEHRKMPTINIVIVGQQKGQKEDKPGCYEYILIDEKTGRHKRVKSDMMPHTTPNKAIIMGLMDGVAKLKFPCHVKVYVKTHVGFRKMIRGNKSPNADLLYELRELLLEKGHVIQEIFNVDKVVELFDKYE